MRRVLLAAGLASACLGAGLLLHACGGCVRENRAATATIDPPQSCLQLELTHDSSGILFCGDTTDVGGVNHCSDAFAVGVAHGASAADGGAADGGAVAGTQVFPPGASISFPVSRADARTDADGSLHWDLPGTLGAQALVVHLAAGPRQ